MRQQRPGMPPTICASTVISTVRMAPVASALLSNARAVSLVSLLAIMPEPTTVATRIAVPSAS